MQNTKRKKNAVTILWCEPGSMRKLASKLILRRETLSSLEQKASRHQSYSRYMWNSRMSTALYLEVFERPAFEEHAKTETDFLSTLSVLYIRLLLPYKRPVEFGKELSLWAWQWIGWGPEILCCRVHALGQVSQPKKISYLSLLDSNIH